MGHLTYLIFEVAWAVPVLVLQWIVGRRPLWKARVVVCTSVLLATTYLSVCDAVAISQHIWTLHASRILGLQIGVVPVEEMIFFLLTNAMVVQSVVLVRAYVGRSH